MATPLRITRGHFVDVRDKGYLYLTAGHPMTSYKVLSVKVDKDCVRSCMHKDKVKNCMSSAYASGKGPFT